LNNAFVLTTVSRYLAESLGTLHKGKQIFTIPNGFDLQEVNNTNVGLTNKFTITYTGILYNGKRDPSKLFKAIHHLILEGKIKPNDIMIRFYGPKEDWMNEEIKQCGLQDIVIEYGVIPRNFVLEKQRESQLLLLLLWDHPEEIGVFTGKVFEYLAAQRPILAIGGPTGVVKDLLEETNAGTYATSIDDIERIIIHYYNEYKLNGNINYKGKKEQIKNYNHREMTRKFSIILDEIIINQKEVFSK
jgi:glycosyltransferase involved in cell wall biosynthesis